jgi:hypothetical protein
MGLYAFYFSVVLVLEKEEVKPMALSEWLISSDKAKHLTASEILAVQGLLEGTSRIVIYMYTLSVGLFAFAGYSDFFIMVFACVLLMALSLSYGFYTCAEVWRIMRHHRGFSAFHYLVYIFMFSLLTVILVALVANYDGLWESLKGKVVPAVLDTPGPVGGPPRKQIDKGSK